MTYRTDGAVMSVTRALTETSAPRNEAVAPMLAPSVVSRDGRRQVVSRVFAHDTVGRRIASSDPDTDNASSPDGHWRYAFNLVGDLAAVRDPRGCGQNFYYDRAGRLLGEDYLRCDEARAPADVPEATIPAGSIGPCARAPAGGRHAKLLRRRTGMGAGPAGARGRARDAVRCVRARSADRHGGPRAAKPGGVRRSRHPDLERAAGRLDAGAGGGCRRIRSRFRRCAVARR